MVPYTDISRKVFGKNVHATILKGDMGYDLYAVPDSVAVELTLICCFPLAIANISPWSLVPFLQISLKNGEKPPTLLFGIVACTFSYNLSRNSCIFTRKTVSRE